MSVAQDQVTFECGTDTETIIAVLHRATDRIVAERWTDSHRVPRPKERVGVSRGSF